MKTIDPKPYDQSTRDTSVKLFMELMAFSAAADYSRVAVLKIGDRIDDHVYTYNGQSAKFHDVSHRQVANAIDFHHYIDRMMLNYYKYLLDTVSTYNTPTGPLLDQGVTIYCNQCATGAHSFSNIPWIQAGTANGYFKKGQYVVVGNGQQPGGSQDGKGGDALGLGRQQDAEHLADGGGRDQDRRRAHRRLRRAVAAQGDLHRDARLVNGPRASGLRGGARARGLGLGRPSTPPALPLVSAIGGDAGRRS